MGRKRDKGKEARGGDDRIDLDEAVLLLQECAAASEPITRDQVRAFRRRPAGPIVPDEVVSCVRLDTWWSLGGFDPAIRREHEPPDQEHWWHDHVYDVQADRNGKPWVAALVNRDCIVTNGEHRFQISPRGGQSICGAEIQGFAESGIPLVMVEDMESFDRGMDSPHPRFFRGDVEASPSDKTSAVYGTWLPDGTLAWVAMEWQRLLPTERRYSVWREDKKIVDNTDRRYKKFLIDPQTGALLGIWNERCPDGWRDELGIVGNDRAIHVAVGLIGAAVVYNELIVVRGDHKAPDLYRFNTQFNTWTAEETSCVGYERWLTEVAETGGFAYVREGRRRVHDRHGNCPRTESWVLRSSGYKGASVILPNHDRVSQLFQTDDRTRYYGVTGRHLYLMGLPKAATSSGTK